VDNDPILRKFRQRARAKAEKKKRDAGLLAQVEAVEAGQDGAGASSSSLSSYSPKKKKKKKKLRKNEAGAASVALSSPSRAETEFGHGDPSRGKAGRLELEMLGLDAGSGAATTAEIETPEVALADTEMFNLTLPPWRLGQDFVQPTDLPVRVLTDFAVYRASDATPVRLDHLPELADSFGFHSAQTISSKDATSKQVPVPGIVAFGTVVEALPVDLRPRPAPRPLPLPPRPVFNATDSTAVKTTVGIVGMDATGAAGAAGAAGSSGGDAAGAAAAGGTSIAADDSNGAADVAAIGTAAEATAHKKKRGKQSRTLTITGGNIDSETKKARLKAVAAMVKKAKSLSLPMTHKGVTVTALGTIDPSELFHSDKHIFPVGFESHCQFFDVDHPTSKKKVDYVSQIVRDTGDTGQAVFQVTKAGGGSKVFRSFSATSVWSKIVSAINDARGKRGKKPLKASSIQSGFDNFGLSSPNVRALIEASPKAIDCQDYVFFSMRGKGKGKRKKDATFTMDLNAATGSDGASSKKKAKIRDSEKKNEGKDKKSEKQSKKRKRASDDVDEGGDVADNELKDAAEKAAAELEKAQMAAVLKARADAIAKGYKLTDDGQLQELPQGWSKQVKFRESGATAGQRDTYYLDPLGKRYRSIVEVERALGIRMPKKGGRGGKKKKTGAKRGRKNADPETEKLINQRHELKSSIMKPTMLFNKIFELDDFWKKAKKEYKKGEDRSSKKMKKYIRKFKDKCYALLESLAGHVSSKSIEDSMIMEHLESYTKKKNKIKKIRVAAKAFVEDLEAAAAKFDKGIADVTAAISARNKAIAEAKRKERIPRKGPVFGPAPPARDEAAWRAKAPLLERRRIKLDQICGWKISYCYGDHTLWLCTPRAMYKIHNHLTSRGEVPLLRPRQDGTGEDAEGDHIMLDDDDDAMDRTNMEVVLPCASLTPPEGVDGTNVAGDGTKDAKADSQGHNAGVAVGRRASKERTRTRTRIQLAPLGSGLRPSYNYDQAFKPLARKFAAASGLVSTLQRLVASEAKGSHKKISLHRVLGEMSLDGDLCDDLAREDDELGGLGANSGASREEIQNYVVRHPVFLLDQLKRSTNQDARRWESCKGLSPPASDKQGVSREDEKLKDAAAASSAKKDDKGEGDSKNKEDVKKIENKPVWPFVPKAISILDLPCRNQLAYQGIRRVTKLSGARQAKQEKEEKARLRILALEENRKRREAEAEHARRQNERYDDMELLTRMRESQQSNASSSGAVSFSGTNIPTTEQKKEYLDLDVKLKRWPAPDFGTPLALSPAVFDVVTQLASFFETYPDAKGHGNRKWDIWALAARGRVLGANSTNIDPNSRAVEQFADIHIQLLTELVQNAYATWENQDPDARFSETSMTVFRDDQADPTREGEFLELLQVLRAHGPIVWPEVLRRCMRSSFDSNGNSNTSSSSAGMSGSSLLHHLEDPVSPAGTTLCHRVWESIMEDDRSRLFKEPVRLDGSINDHYNSKVPKPMDLGTIGSRLTSGIYGSSEGSQSSSDAASSVDAFKIPTGIEQFHQDIRSVFTNCIKFWSDFIDDVDPKDGPIHARLAAQQEELERRREIQRAKRSKVTKAYNVIVKELQKENKDAATIDAAAKEAEIAAAAAEGLVLDGETAKGLPNWVYPGLTIAPGEMFDGAPWLDETMNIDPGGLLPMISEAKELLKAVDKLFKLHVLRVLKVHHALMKDVRTLVNDHSTSAIAIHTAAMHGASEQAAAAANASSSSSVSGSVLEAWSACGDGETLTDSPAARALDCKRLMAKLWSVDVAAAQGTLSDRSEGALSSDELCFTLCWLLNEVLGSDHWRQDMADRRARQHQMFKDNNEMLRLVKARDKHKRLLGEHLEVVRLEAEKVQREKAEKATADMAARLASGHRVSSRAAVIAPEDGAAAVTAAVRQAREAFLEQAGDTSQFDHLPASKEAAKELTLERKELLRLKVSPLGTDRYGNRYWAFPNLRANLKKPKAPAMLVVEHVRSGAMFTYQDETSLSQLTGSLLARGKKENKLKQNLERLRPNLLAGIKQARDIAAKLDAKKARAYASDSQNIKRKHFDQICGALKSIADVLLKDPVLLEDNGVLSASGPQADGNIGGNFSSALEAAFSHPSVQACLSATKTEVVALMEMADSRSLLPWTKPIHKQVWSESVRYAETFSQVVFLAHRLIFFKAEKKTFGGAEMNAASAAVKMAFIGECGVCKYCKDKPKFGGNYTLRQACILRQQAKKAQIAQRALALAKIKKSPE
jgi:hypothetical protein